MDCQCPYPLEGRDLSTINEAEFIRAANISPIIHEKGTKIVMITSIAVMKIGFEVLQQEALNMEYVYRNSQGQLRVPRVYRSFNIKGLGYIVMEFINGDSLDVTPWSKRTVQEQQNIILQVTKALLCLKDMQYHTPGPVGPGIPMGGPFTIYGAGETFLTAADMELWFNKKLKIYGTGDVTGRFKDLVMCHLDISLRNLMLDKAGRLWILDWAWAGFFPPEFEMASLQHRRADDPDFDFFQQILCKLQGRHYDNALLALLLQVCQVNDGPFQGSHLI